MVNENCIKQGNNGDIIINCALMPDKIFIDANKTKEIAHARILSKQEKKSAGLKAGEPDVLLVLSSGGTKRISRRQLCSDYVLSNGKKIVLAVLRTSTNYLVYKVCNEKFKAFKIPVNCKAIVNGKIVDGNYYIVCGVDESGNLKRDTMGVVSSRVFKKQFKVPMQEVIRRNMNTTKVSGAFKLFERRNRVTQESLNKHKNKSAVIQSKSSVVQNQSQTNVGKLNINPSNIRVPSVNDIKQQMEKSKPQQQGRFSGNRGVNTFRNNTASIENNNYKFTVVNRLVDMNNRFLGFTVREIDSGKTRNITPQELNLLCKNKLVDNVAIITKDNGQSFLRGNGIRLEALPSVIV